MNRRRIYGILNRPHKSSWLNQRSRETSSVFWWGIALFAALLLLGVALKKVGVL